MNSSGSQTRWATKEELEAELVRLRKLNHIASIRMQICDIEAMLKGMSEQEQKG